ncbi:Digestive cysteine proteinase 2, partial [Armadillidium vulgare]
SKIYNANRGVELRFIKYNKEYSPEEEIKRHKIFNENKLMIEEHNKKFKEGEVTFTMKINKFSDMLLEETSYLRGYKPSKDPPKGGLLYMVDDDATFPDSVDWREKGYVTPVKDQGDCGSCWAFSAKTGKLVSLSEQNFIDCMDDRDYDCDGCWGGLTTSCFLYTKENNGTDSEESYPYLAKRELLAATATVGPISVAIDAHSLSFQQYSQGVYYNPTCDPDLHNHAVLVTGYGTYNGEEYWMVKNSWGTEWGDNGYIMMARNRSNNCDKYNKEYSPEEDIKRHQIFNENKLMIEEHNKKFEEGEVTFTMEINKFSDIGRSIVISVLKTLVEPAQDTDTLLKAPNVNS